MGKEKDPRAGHRQRVRERYAQTGLSGFAPHEVLELLLQFSIPRKDTKTEARALIEKFGSINGVFAAKRNLLTQVEGIGETSATLLHLVTDVVRYCDEQKVKKIKTLSNTREFGEYAMNILSHRRNEVFYVFALDSNCRLLYTESIGNGNPSEVLINMKDVVAVAFENKASAIVLAHNHPSGILEASEADIEITQEINEVLKSLGIVLLDHIIVCDGDYISMAESGVF